MNFKSGTGALTLLLGYMQHCIATLSGERQHRVGGGQIGDEVSSEMLGFISFSPTEL
ncbi:MAG: hypothetical protein K8R50_08445 [Betaproteobacteria bacterium]|nr:hypothetical protein [Betaproteobacteria bacterium]